MAFTSCPSVLVTDFDGTVTANDFYLLAVERLLSDEDIAPWGDYRAGRITHFEALRRILGRIRAPQADILDLIHDMLPDPELGHYVGELRNAGWEVVVASAGCHWYIDRLLEEQGVELEVHANPGHYEEGGPLVVRADDESPFYCPKLGVNKAAIVRHHQERGARVAFSGDGYPDEEASLLVPPSLRFAKRDLAGVLTTRGESFRPFSAWSDVARALLEKNS